MPATGPHTFTDTEGVEWEITGPNKAAPTYANIVRTDGSGITSLRPIGVLAPAGLSIPTRDEKVSMEVTIIDTGEPESPPLYPALAAIEEQLTEVDGLGRTLQFVTDVTS